MLSTSGREWPAGDGWILEPKWDGYRLLVDVELAGRVRAWSRHGTSLTSQVGDPSHLRHPGLRPAEDPARDLAQGHNHRARQRRDIHQMGRTEPSRVPKTIAEHQSIQNLLADMAVDLYTSHTVAMDCASRAGAGHDVRAETALVKYHATNAAVRVYDNAIQIHGGMGFAAETKLTDGWRHARISRMTEGSDQIMQRTIAGLMLKRGLPDWGAYNPGVV